MHRSKLEEHKTISPIPDPFLTIKNRSRRGDPDPPHDQDHEYWPARQGQQNKCDVESPFPAWYFGMRRLALARVQSRTTIARFTGERSV